MKYLPTYLPIALGPNKRGKLPKLYLKKGNRRGKRNKKCLWARKQAQRAQKKGIKKG